MNTTNKHTESPWHIGINPGPIIYGPSGEQVASLFPALLEEQENKANARLIASAPSLLEALQALTERASALDQSATEEGLRNCSAIANARQAIAKATGEQS
jgi:hypothetical protein